MATTPSPEAQLLEIRDRRTLGADGVELHRTVDCPRRAASADLSDCSHCGLGTIVWPEGAGRARIACTHEVGASLSARIVSLDGNTQVKTVMSPDVACIRAEASLDSIATLFLEDGLTALPVIDAEGRPIGLVSKTDLLRELRERGEIPTTAEDAVPRGFHVDRDVAMTAGDVMTPLVFAVLENATIAQAVPLMAFEGVHHAPVVTSEGRVVGVLSSMDLMRWLSSALRAG